MNLKRFRTARMQMLLITGVLGVALVMAVFLATQRAFFERYAKDKFTPLPAHLNSVWESLGKGDYSKEKLKKLSDADLEALYEKWMSEDLNPIVALQNVPMLLVEANAETIMKRIEVTLIVGNKEQRLKACEFLKYSRSKLARTLLESAWNRSKRRGEEQVAKKIKEILSQIS